MIIAALMREAINAREAMDKSQAALRRRRHDFGFCPVPLFFWDAMQLGRRAAQSKRGQRRLHEDVKFQPYLPYLIPGRRLLRLGRKAWSLKRSGKIRFSVDRGLLPFTRRYGVSLAWD